MNQSSATERFGREARLTVAGMLTSLAVAVGLLSRFGINDTLKRDQAIYAYGGQQMAHGVPPYASIFDPKTPLATMIAGLAAVFARAARGNDIYWIRWTFFGFAILTVLAVFLLASRLWSSVLAGVVAAVVFASFNGFAFDSLAGPDAKTPGIAAVVLSMWLLLRRQWFWAAFAGSIGFLVWQPFAIYPVVVAAVGLVDATAGQRRRAFGFAVIGAAIPIAVVTGYFVITGAVGKFITAALVFPATGVKRQPETLRQHFTRIFQVVHDAYAVSGVLLWIGIVILVALAVAHVIRNRDGVRHALRHPLMIVVMTTLLAMLGYSVFDFQGPPDVFPLLPYGALGLGGAAAVAVKALTPAWSRRTVTAMALVGVTVLGAFSWMWFTDQPRQGVGLRAQRADGCAVEQMVAHGATLYALGDPTPLVITHLRNPDRFIYLGSGVALWKIRHTKGGLNGWLSQIEAKDNSMITIGDWFSQVQHKLQHRLVHDNYLPEYLGSWHVFLSPAARTAARVAHVRFTRRPTLFAAGTTGGRELQASGCG
jgi:hypothetical protein